jgi:hypothetical protein
MVRPQPVQVGADAKLCATPELGASTTIPVPSSVEEEGGRSELP